MFSFTKEPQRSCGLGLLGAGLMLGSYWLLWGSVAGFVNAIDHGALLFGDFRRFYYPMGEVLFAEKWPVRGYYYTSFFALSLCLIALLKLAAATVLWGVLQVGWAAALYWISGRYLLKLSAQGLLVYFLLLLASFPLLHNFRWGQVSVLVTLGIVSAFALHQQGRSALAGIALALVTCIKYYPGAFVVYFLMRRDRCFLAAYGAGLLGFYGLLPAALLGPVDWWYFERASAQSLPEAARLLRDLNTQYFVHVLSRWGQPLGYRLSESTLDVLRVVGVLVFCANSVAVWWLNKRNIAHRVALSAVALFIALPFVVPTSWPHYFVFLPFCQTALWVMLGEARAHWLWRVPVAFSAVLASGYCFALFPSWRLYNGIGALWVADAALLCSLYGLALRRRLRS